MAKVRYQDPVTKRFVWREAGTAPPELVETKQPAPRKPRADATLTDPSKDARRPRVRRERVKRERRVDSRPHPAASKSSDVDWDHLFDDTDDDA